MPCFSRSRLLVPTLMLLSSAVLVAKGDESIPRSLPAAIDAEPLSESGVRLVRLLEEDVDEAEVPRAPADVNQLTRLDLEGQLSIGATPLLTVRQASSPFNLIQAALLTFTAGGATGGIWFAISRLRGSRSKVVAPLATRQAESTEGDLLARVIAGNIRVTDERLEPLDLSRMFGRATVSTRYRIETNRLDAVLEPVEVAAKDGAFHRLSEGAASVEPPHFQNRQPANSAVERAVHSDGVSP